MLTIPFINDCVVVGVPDEKELEVPMAYVELKEECKTKFDEIEEKIREKLIEELPDYEVPKYILSIDKIPYYNGKQAFKVLEKEGNLFVNAVKKVDQ